MSKIVEFKMAKGITVEKGQEQWTRKSLELTVQMPEQHTEEDIHSAIARTEYIIDTWLGQPEVPQVPQFNSEELMKHVGWKAKKKDDGSYAEGSLSWGWEFADKFSKEILRVLEKGPLTIDKYEFSLNKEQTLVSVKKKKGA